MLRNGGSNSAIRNTTARRAEAGDEKNPSETSVLMIQNNHHDHSSPVRSRSSSSRLSSDADNLEKNCTKLDLTEHTSCLKRCCFSSLRSTWLVCLTFVVLLFFVSVVSIFSYFQYSDKQKNPCITANCVQTAAFLLEAMDWDANPCEDFYQFACGTWNRKHAIPDDRPSISTFEILSDQLQLSLRNLLESKSSTFDSEATEKAKKFYRSCMDSAEILRVGDVPVRQVIQDLGEWPVTQKNWSLPNISLERFVATLKRNFTVGVLIEEWIGPDDRNSNVHILQIDQPSLGLPNRDYFLHHESRKDLDAYHKYMVDVAVLMGANEQDASEQMVDVINFERKLANISIPEVDRLDTGEIYHKLRLQDLSKLIPEIDWSEYFKYAIEPIITDENEMVVSYSTEYFKLLGGIIQKTDKRTIHNYLIWRLVMYLMPQMPSEYEAARANFRRVLLGVLKDRNRWSRCVDWTNKKFGMAVGELFIRDNFKHESKAMALEMIHDIRDAFNDLLESNQWMDTETRLVAKDKANKMNEKIGYPDYITNTTRLNNEYKNLVIDSKQFLINMFTIMRFEADRNIATLRNSVDREKWSTQPAIVNAFYNPNKNDIVFPAGILQPLFYSSNFPKSLNYGGIGVVIGHEITHGFDDKGRQFDKQGNLKQWWNNRTIAAFRREAQCMVDQYSKYELPEIRRFVDGRMTQGENIADNGGLKQAYKAYQKWVKENGEETPLPGLNLSHNQLFFLNYAQIWCGSSTPEELLTKIRSSVHSPGPIRVHGPLSNSRDFSKAYDCPIGSKMNPIKKCSVW